MGTYKQDEARKADQSLLDSPVMMVDSRQRVLAQVMAVDELFREPDTENAVLSVLSHNKVYQNIEVQWNQSNFEVVENNVPAFGGVGFITKEKTLRNLGKKFTMLHGYPIDQCMFFEMGSRIEMVEEEPDLYLSNDFEISVLITNLDGDTEVEMSNDPGSTFTIGTNTFSNFIGDYYLAQNYETGELYNIDDDLTVYTTPLPFIPKNTVNGDVTQTEKPKEPTEATDIRRDYRLSGGILVMDIYRPEAFFEIEVNSVGPSITSPKTITVNTAYGTTEKTVAGVIGVQGFNSSTTANILLTSKGHTVSIRRILSQNTDTAVSMLECDSISNEAEFDAGNIFQPGDFVQQDGGTGAFGYIGGATKKFRWAISESNVNIPEGAANSDSDDFINGFEQDAWSQQYGTMNVQQYLHADTGGLYPAKLILAGGMSQGVGNIQTGYADPPTDTAYSTLPPPLGKTLVLRRHIGHDEVSAEEQATANSGDDARSTVPEELRVEPANTTAANVTPPTIFKEPPHTNALLAVVSGRGMQINFDWFRANNRHDNSANTENTTTIPVQEMTKMDQTTWEPYLGWFANSSNAITRSGRRQEFASSQANTGTNNMQFTQTRFAGERSNEHYAYIENNPFFPRVDDAPDKSAPYAGAFAYWDGTLNKDSNNVPRGGAGFAVYSELRWRCQPNPRLTDYDRANAENIVTSNRDLPGYFETYANGDGDEASTINTVLSWRATDALGNGVSRLKEARYDGGHPQQAENPYSWHVDGDRHPAEINLSANVIHAGDARDIWIDKTAKSTTLPAWTHTGSSTYDPFPKLSSYATYDPSGNETFRFSVSLYTTAANMRAGVGHPFSPPEYQAGTYYTLINGKIFKVDAIYDGGTDITGPVTTTNPDGSTNTTIQYIHTQHTLTYYSEEHPSDINIVARFINSNDWKAVRTLKSRWLTNDPTRDNTINDEPFSAGPIIDPFYEDYDSGGWQTQPGESIYDYADWPGSGATVGQMHKDEAFNHYLRWVHDRWNQTELDHFNNQYSGAVSDWVNYGTGGGTIQWTYTYTHQEFFEPMYYFEQIRNDYINSLRFRIGFPVTNSASYDWNGGAGTSAEGYSKEVYEAADILMNDDTGTVIRGQSALRNINSIYEDAESNRKRYKVYAEN